MKLLVLRPQAGGEATAARAAKLGFDPVVAPLFQYRTLPWSPPALDTVDALLLTSAAGVRLGGDRLAPFRSLPVQAVGMATAAAARAAGFEVIGTVGKDAAAAVAVLAARGYRTILHPTGRDHIMLTHPLLTIRSVPVYAADAVDRLPAAAGQAIDDHAIALLHSPRAANAFADLLERSGRGRDAIRIACFSPAVANAAGAGWARVAVATHPTDDALFAAAGLLCDQGGNGIMEPR